MAPGTLWDTVRVTNALKRPRWPLMCGASYVVMTRHISVRVPVLSLDPRAMFVDNPRNPSIGVPAVVLRDLEYQILYISISSCLTSAVGYPVTHRTQADTLPIN